MVGTALTRGSLAEATPVLASYAAGMALLLEGVTLTAIILVCSGCEGGPTGGQCAAASQGDCYLPAGTQPLAPRTRDPLSRRRARLRARGMEQGRQSGVRAGWNAHLALPLCTEGRSNPLSASGPAPFCPLIISWVSSQGTHSHLWPPPPGPLHRSKAFLDRKPYSAISR